MLTRRNLNPSTNSQREKINWEYYNPPENSTPANFCLDSSLHGLQYIGQQNRHCFERLFWCTAFIASVVCAGLLISKLWETHTDSPIVTVFNPIDTSLRQIAFPSVTFCNVNKIKLSKMNEYFNDVDNAKKSQNETSYLKSLAAVLDLKNVCSLETFTRRMVAETTTPWTHRYDNVTEDLDKRMNDYDKFLDPAKLLLGGSQKCDEMLVYCLWENNDINCSELFRPIVTDYGYCCTFNMIPPSLLIKNLNDSKDDPVNVKEWEKADVTTDNLVLSSDSTPQKFPYRQQYHSRSSGLSVILQPNLTEYYCTSTDSEGFLLVALQVGLKGALDFPRMKDDGMLVKPGMETFIKIHPQITVSDSSIKKYPWKIRNCFFNDEVSEWVDYYTKYTATNCLSQCISEFTMILCNCVRYYMPRNSSQPLCKPDKYDCATEVERNVTEGEGYCVGCPRTCTDVQYQAEVTHVGIRKYQTAMVQKAFPQRKSNDLAIVHLYFSQPAYQTRLRKEMYTIIDLISSAGGLLGLCMGFSMLSVLEIVYYYTLRLCFIYRKKYIEKVKTQNDLSVSPYVGEKKGNQVIKVSSQYSTIKKDFKDPIFKVQSRSAWTVNT